MDVALRAAFPIWLMELNGRDEEYLQKRASICAQAIAEKGDVLMYGSKRPGAAGEVFNRLAEGMACLTMITRHPVPFGKMVFYHSGEVEVFETEKEANERVWPELSKLRKEGDGPLQPEAVQTVCDGSGSGAQGNTDAGADSAGEKLERQEAGD